ncbi:tetratricopeptide repeat protein [Acidobacteriota bacterium]
MNRKITFFLFAAAPLILALSGCSRPFLKDQLNFGIQAAQKELWEEAIFRWRKVIQVNPQSAEAHNNLAVALEKKALWEEAKKEYEIAINLSPENKYIESNHKNFTKRLEDLKKDKNEKQ